MDRELPTNRNAEPTAPIGAGEASSEHGPFAEPLDLQHPAATVSQGSDRVRFLAVAAAVGILFIGLGWLVQRSLTSTDPANDSNDGSTSEPIVLEAEDMATKVEGEASPGGWGIWRPGFIEDEITFTESGTYEFVVLAKGQFEQPGGLGPDLELLVDSLTVEPFHVVQMDVSAPYRFVTEVEAGDRRITVSNAELNVPTQPTDERGLKPVLVVDRIEITRIDG